MSASPLLVADFLAQAFVELGVRHVFGVGGANIEDVFVAVQRRRPELGAVLNKHEHAGGTAADAYARISGGLGVVLATSGGGAMNLVHALAEARASHVPLLAIVGEPPSALQGRGAFQDTSGRSGLVDALCVYRGVAKFCERVEDVNELPRLLTEAVRAATTSPEGPALLLIAKDRQTATLEASLPVGWQKRATVPGPSREGVARALKLLREGPVVVIAGDEVARACAEQRLAQVVERLNALVAVTPDARDAFDNRSTRFLGVAGSMGHPEVARALGSASTVLVAGSRLPLLARQGLEPLLAERALVTVGREPAFVKCRENEHVSGELGAVLGAFVEGLEPHGRYAEQVRAAPRTLSGTAADEPERFDSAVALRAIERALPEQSVVLIDAGNTGAAAAHVLRAPRNGRWLLALGMAGMGYTFGAAIGAALASGRRCFALAGDGAFFMHGLEIHTALEHALPITFVIFNNGAHGMCLVRERLLLKTSAEYNEFARAAPAPGLAALFPGLLAFACRTRAELEQALARTEDAVGPALISIELSAVEVPPFAPFQAAGGRAFTALGAGVEP